MRIRVDCDSVSRGHESLQTSQMSKIHESKMTWSQEMDQGHGGIWNDTCPYCAKVDRPSLVAALLTDPKRWAICSYSAAHSFQRAYGMHISQLSEEIPARQCYLVTHRAPRPQKIRSLEIFDQYFVEFLSSVDQGQ